VVAAYEKAKANPKTQINIHINVQTKGMQKS
jgi:hypothetical protein